MKNKVSLNLIQKIIDSNNKFCLHLIAIKGKATVPGNIYQDLKNKKVIDDLYYEYSDVNNTWVANESWIYTKKFTGKLLKFIF